MWNRLFFMYCYISSQQHLSGKGTKNMADNTTFGTSAQLSYYQVSCLES